MYGEENELEEEDNFANKSSTSDEESNKFWLSRQGYVLSPLSHESCSFSNDTLEEAFDELTCEYEKIKLKHEERISNINVGNDFLKNKKLNLEDESRRLKIDLDFFWKNLMPWEKKWKVEKCFWKC